MDKKKQRMLLHICCAPCSPYVIDLLKANFQLTLFFYNPNIQPEKEYQFRIEEMRVFVKQIGIEMIEGKYQTDIWKAVISGYEKEPEGGKRCERCFAIRLKETAELAEKRGDDFFTTVLSISPHKDSVLINSIGKKAAYEKNTTFHEADFKKKNGFAKSVALAKRYGLKRQNYCGCLFSR